jgi:hypothetical protein
MFQRYSEGPRAPAFGRDGRPDSRRLREESRFFVGLDLGKAQDHTAIAVIERAALVWPERDPVTMAWREETQYWLRHGERLPLGTAYLQIVEHVKQLVQREPLRGRAVLVVDATGVGAPVVELLQGPSGVRGACPVVPVVITGGMSASLAAAGTSGGCSRVPKRDLMEGLQVAFETRRLGVAQGLRCWPMLQQELREMRVQRSSKSGASQYGGKRDDLVLALALAWWRAEQYRPFHGARRLV